MASHDYERRRPAASGLALFSAIAFCWLASVAVSRAAEEIAEPRTTDEYVELARRFLPKEVSQQLLTERYILLSPAGRETFKRRNARTRHMEYQAFAVCYYRAVEAGMRNDLAAFRCYDKFVRKYLP